MSRSCYHCDYEVSDGRYLCDPADSNICEPCRKLSELGEKIKSAKRMLVDLVEEHVKLKEQANYNHDRLTQRLPPEIAGHIFGLCLPEDAMNINLDYHVSCSAIKPICAPLILSAVCRRWRAIAHSTPRLWTTLLLCPGDTSNSYNLSDSCIQEWINRAGLLPLSFSFCSSANAKTPIRIIDTVNKHSDRWLQLGLYGDHEFLSLFSSRRRELPLLQSLYLVNSNPRFLHIPTLSLNPTRLKILSIIGIKLGAVNFDLQHLIQLEMGKPMLSHWFEALRRAPRLTHCKWTGQALWDDQEFPLPRNPIVHTNMQDLEFVETSLYEKVFKHLSCPSLTTLTISFFKHVVDIPCIVGFLRTSSCSLERLSLKDGQLSDPDLLSLCEGIPTLQHLHIDFLVSYSWLAPKLFDLLAEFSIINGRKYPLYLPALRSLSLRTETIPNSKMLPRIFGTPTDQSSPGIDRHRHTLESVAISVEMGDDPDLVHTMPEETLKEIIHLRKTGVKWNLKYRGRTEDIIELAWFGIYGKSLT